jgi:hypothetical protein
LCRPLAWPRLRACERDVGDFWGAVEAHGEAYGAEAAVDVELHVTEVEEAFDVLAAHGREDERAGEGQAHLAAVGVAGEHEVDHGEAGVEDDFVGEVGLVDHEEDGGARDGRNGEVEVGDACAGVVGAADPDAVAAALEGDVGFERLDDVAGSDGDVVIAEHGEALGSGEAAEDFGAESRGLPGELVTEWTAADVVTGEQDEVRLEGVDAVDGVGEEPGFGVLPEVNVGELGDAEVGEGVGQILNGEAALGDFEVVTPVGSAVEANGRGGPGRTEEEGAAGVGRNMQVSPRVGLIGHGSMIPGEVGGGDWRAARRQGCAGRWSEGKIKGCRKLTAVDGRWTRPEPRERMG